MSPYSSRAADRAHRLDQRDVTRGWPVSSPATAVGRTSRGRTCGGECARVGRRAACRRPRLELSAMPGPWLVRPVRRVHEHAVDVCGPADRVQRPAVDLGPVHRALRPQPRVRRHRIGQHVRVERRVVDRRWSGRVVDHEPILPAGAGAGPSWIKMQGWRQWIVPARTWSGASHPASPRCARTERRWLRVRPRRRRRAGRDPGAAGHGVRRAGRFARRSPGCTRRSPASSATRSSGPSRVLVLGPDSSVSPLIFAAIVPLVVADDDPRQAIALAGHDGPHRRAHR